MGGQSAYTVWLRRQSATLQGPDQLQELVAFGFHFNGAVFAGFVVVAQQVQDPVHQQLVETLLKRQSRCRAFPLRGFRRNDHITEQLWRYFGIVSFLHGKCDDVGGAPAIEVLFVQGCDFGVVDDQDGELDIRIARGV